jgi:2'-hydroxyisoflavone reductase
MRILVLGGTAWLSRMVAEEAARRGHEVTSASRGKAGPPAAGVRHISVDRDTATPEELVAATGPAGGLEGYDAVVDVSRTPSHARAAAAAYPNAHWVFVSTCSVYADHSAAGGTVETSPLLDPVTTDEDPSASPDLYGAMKVACEESVREFVAEAMVIRAGLIVGPGDPSGRFAYWPARIADGGEVLSPASPDDAVQVVDVRDLATWIVDSVEARLTGTYDGISRPVSRRHLLQDIAHGCDAQATFTWVPTEFLTSHEVAEWSGPRSLPLWVADPDWQGFMARDTSSAIDAGLRIRPFTETARDTLTWLRTSPDAAVTGLTRAEEAAVLGAWHTLGA